jgi:hypothetical protein
MNITNIELTDAQWERLQLLAVQEATRRDHPKPAGDETPQNVLRLALGFETRKQGGWRGGRKGSLQREQSVQPDPVRSSEDDPNDRNGQPWTPWNPYK